MTWYGDADDVEAGIQRDMDRAERQRKAVIGASVTVSIVSLALLTVFGAMAVSGSGVDRARANSVAADTGPRSVATTPSWTVPEPDPVSTPEVPEPQPTALATVTAPTAAAVSTTRPQSNAPTTRVVKKPMKKRSAATTKTALQRASVNIGSYGYEPTVVRVTAGVPVALTVGRGEGCAAGFLMPELGISADNSQRSVTLRLPALRPGTYQFSCGMGMIYGTLRVQ